MYFEIKKDTPTKPYDKHWQFCVGSGHAPLALRADYCHQAKMVHDDLGIRQMRFHGIFCDDMHTSDRLTDVFPLPPIDGTPSFRERSFRLCALAYDNLLASGMKPFVELGFMPQALAKSETRGSFFYKPCISMPRDDQEWTAYIQDFIQFLQNRYGRDEVETWFFEVWNEPDLQVAFFDGTQADYFHLYEVTAHAIKAVNSNLKVGGPSTSGSKWVAAFIKYCKDNNVPVDFVTTHQYAGDPLGGVSDQGDAEGDDIAELYRQKMSTVNFEQLLAGLPPNAVLPTIRRFMQDEDGRADLSRDTFPKNAAIVKQQAEGLPVYYTEWNACAVLTAYSNDTRRVAAYNARTCLALEGVVSGSSVWCFSDIFEEMHPFPEEFHGGFGLLTQSGIKKPSYHAMKMLADAGNERYDLPEGLDGEISIAAFKDDTETQVLLMRQKMQNLFDLPKETATVSIEFDERPNRVYLQRIDDAHCNPLKLWEAMGSPQVPTRVQLDELVNASAMEDEEMSFTYENGVLTFSASLGVNDLYFVRIIR